MDVTQLKILIHVAELGSLSRAADRMGIAQPALSRHVRLLEEELGVRLFERHGRGMLVTEIGKEVLDHAARVLAELEAIRSTATGGRASFRGLVTIGTTPTVAAIITAPLVQRLIEAHPHLSVRFSSAFSGHLIDWLLRGELDLAVTYNPQPMRSLRIVPVMVENLLLVGSSDSRLSASRAVSFADLAKLELVLPSPRHGLRDLVDQCARRAGVELRYRVEADSFGAMIDLVRAGFGYTVLPLAPIYQLVQSGELCAAPIVDPVPTRKLVVAYPADRPVTPAARYAGELFASITADLVERGVWAGHVLERPGV
jgi:LysR family nitrogen assimilation transcriptional regulator